MPEQPPAPRPDRPEPYAGFQRDLDNVMMTGNFMMYGAVMLSSSDRPVLALPVVVTALGAYTSVGVRSRLAQRRMARANDTGPGE